EGLGSDSSDARQRPRAKTDAERPRLHGDAELAARLVPPDDRIRHGASLTSNICSTLGSNDGAAGAVPAGDARLVRAELRCADARAGAGLARDRERGPRPDPGADRLGEDARGVPLRNRPP